MIKWKKHKDDLWLGSIFKIVYYGPLWNDSTTPCYIPYYGVYKKKTKARARYLQFGWYITSKTPRYKTLEDAQQACEAYQVSNPTRR